MGVQHLLAKLTAQTPSLEWGPGGVPEISAEEVRAALGFAQRRVMLRRRQPRVVNGVPLQVLLIEAKYLDDARSAKKAAALLARQLYCAWWEHDAAASETISKSQLQRLARTMIDDYCEPEKARKAGGGRLAHAVGMDYRTWKRKFSRFYGQHLLELSRIEGPVIEDLARQFFSQQEQSNE